MRELALWAGLALALGTLGSMAWAGCAREGDRVNTAPAMIGRPGPDTLSGRVRRVGNAPFVRTLVAAEEETMAVTGEFEREVARLVGATVRVTGRRVEGGLGPELHATSYEILSVGGETPTVGWLRGEEGGYRLETPGGRSIPLTTPSESLVEHVDGRVWVVLEEGVVIRHGLLLRRDEATEP